jgi:hypothetical protein
MIPATEILSIEAENYYFAGLAVSAPGGKPPERKTCSGCVHAMQ